MFQLASSLSLWLSSSKGRGYKPRVTQKSSSGPIPPESSVWSWQGYQAGSSEFHCSLASEINLSKSYTFLLSSPSTESEREEKSKLEETQAMLAWEFKTTFGKFSGFISTVKAGVDWQSTQTTVWLSYCMSSEKEAFQALRRGKCNMEEQRKVRRPLQSLYPAYSYVAHRHNV